MANVQLAPFSLSIRHGHGVLRAPPGRPVMRHGKQHCRPVADKAPAQSETRLQRTHGALTLHRYPVRIDEKLRAWDAADELLLNHVAELSEQRPFANVLVVNDAFGALQLGLQTIPALARARIRVISDSAVARAAVRHNAGVNGIDRSAIPVVTRFELASHDADVDLVLLKIPKSLDELDDLLKRIRPRLHANAAVIGAGMVKKVHTSTLERFENVIGETRTSLARKKARLIFSAPSLETSRIEPDTARQFDIPADLTKTRRALTVASYPGVFCHGNLDHGTRFMLSNMQIRTTPGANQSVDVLDLGCGTGVLGLVAAARLAHHMPHSRAAVTFADESFAAIESVRASLQRQVPSPATHHCHVVATHCLDGIEDSAQDLILNNPPFHDAGAKTAAIAVDMFTASRRVLRAGGELQVVANRHLGYHKRLREIFGNVETLGSNSKFVVLRARR